MQLAPKHNTISNGGVQESTSFGIAVNPKMFSILSDGMYEDKHGSMVRELCSNAKDAHIAAGKVDVPFEVHVPNAIEPWFSVTDFGTGISPEDIKTVLTVYGESTKDSSNDQIGAFGLGAKTPFSYTDNFTVRSRYQGVERLYTAHTGATGLPQLDLQLEQPTTESNGFMVMVTVESRDFDVFRAAIFEQLKFFTVKPNLVNNMSEGEFKDLTEGVVYQSDLVTMYDGSWGNGVSGLWLVQGEVGYPINVNTLNIKDRDLEEFTRALDHKDAYMVFDIGQIEVTSSREGIQYTPATIQTIINRIEAISAEMAQSAMDELNAADCVWDRTIVYNKQIDVIRKALQALPNFDTLLAGSVKTRGNQGSYAIDIEPLVKEGFKAVSMQRNYGANQVKRRVIGESVRHTTEYLTPAEDYNIFIRDTKSKPILRIRNFVVEKDFPKTLLIEPYGLGTIEVTEIPAIAKALGIPESRIQLLSSLEVPKTVSTTVNNGYKSPKGFMWSTHKSTTYSRDWQKVHESLDDIGEAIWVEMDRHDIRSDNWENHNLVFAALSRDLIDMPIIAVNAKTAERIRAGKVGEDFMSIEEMATEIRTHIKSLESTIAKYARDAAFLDNLRSNGVIMTMLDQGMFVNLEKRVKAMMERNALLKSKVDQNSWMKPYIKDIQIIVNHAGKQAGDIVEGIYAQYPMLQFVKTRYGYRGIDDAQDIDVIVEYIKSMDEKDQEVVDTAS